MHGDLSHPWELMGYPYIYSDSIHPWPSLIHETKLVQSSCSAFFVLLDPFQYLCLQLFAQPTLCPRFYAAPLQIEVVLHMQHSN